MLASEENIYSSLLATGWSKSLYAPDDYSTKNTQKYRILNSFNHVPW